MAFYKPVQFFRSARLEQPSIDLHSPAVNLHSPAIGQRLDWYFHFHNTHSSNILWKEGDVTIVLDMLRRSGVCVSLSALTRSLASSGQKLSFGAFGSSRFRTPIGGLGVV